MYEKQRLEWPNIEYRTHPRRGWGDSLRPVPWPRYFGPKFALNFTLLDPLAPAAGPIRPNWAGLQHRRKRRAIAARLPRLPAASLPPGRRPSRSGLLLRSGALFEAAFFFEAAFRFETAFFRRAVLRTADGAPPPASGAPNAIAAGGGAAQAEARTRRFETPPPAARRTPCWRRGSGRSAACNRDASRDRRCERRAGRQSPGRSGPGWHLCSAKTRPTERARLPVPDSYILGCELPARMIVAASPVGMVQRDPARRATWQNQ